jgi:hypothetical protein
MAPLSHLLCFHRRSPSGPPARGGWAAMALLLAGLGGCVHGSGPYRPVELGRGEAAILVYRPRSLLSPGPVRLVVDQHEVATLRRNTHAAAIVGPGEHLVRVERRGEATRLVRLGEGESVVLEAGASLLGGRVSLTDPGEAVGASRIAQTRAAVQPVRVEEVID